jgi:hypothetical protein
MFIKSALTLFFKRQQHRKLSWLDKDSDKDQSQFIELFNWTRVILNPADKNSERPSNYNIEKYEKLNIQRVSEIQLVIELNS